MAPFGEVLALDYLALEARRQKLETVQWEALEGIQCRRTVEEHRRSFSVSVLDRRLERQEREKERSQQRNQVLREHASKFKHEAESRLSFQESQGGGLVMPGNLGQRLRGHRDMFVKKAELMTSQYHQAVEEQMRDEIQAAREDTEHCQTRQRELLQAACRQEQLLKDLAVEQKRVLDERCKLYAVDTQMQDRHKSLRAKLEDQWLQAQAVDDESHDSLNPVNQFVGSPSAAVGSTCPAVNVSKSSSRPAAQVVTQCPARPASVGYGGAASASAQRVAHRGLDVSAVDAGEPSPATYTSVADLMSVDVDNSCFSATRDFQMPQGLRSVTQPRREYLPAKGTRQFEVYQRLKAYELEMQSDLRVLDQAPKAPPPLQLHPVGIGSDAYMSAMFNSSVGPPVIVVGSSSMPIPAPPRTAADKGVVTQERPSQLSQSFEGRTAPWQQHMAPKPELQQQATSQRAQLDQLLAEQQRLMQQELHVQMQLQQSLAMQQHEQAVQAPAQTTQSVHQSFASLSAQCPQEFTDTRPLPSGAEPSAVSAGWNDEPVQSVQPAPKSTDHELRDLMAWAQAPRNSSLLDLSSSCGGATGRDGSLLDAVSTADGASTAIGRRGIVDAGHTSAAGGNVLLAANASALLGETLPSQIGSKSSSGVGACAEGVAGAEDTETSPVQGRETAKDNPTKSGQSPILSAAPSFNDSAHEAVGVVKPQPALPPRPSYPSNNRAASANPGLSALGQRQQPEASGGMTDRSMTQPSMSGSEPMQAAPDGVRTPASWMSDGGASKDRDTADARQTQSSTNVAQPFPIKPFGAPPFGDSGALPIKPFGASSAAPPIKPFGASSAAPITAEACQTSSQPPVGVTPSNGAYLGVAAFEQATTPAPAEASVFDQSSFPQRSPGEVMDSSLKMDSSGEPDMDAFIPFSARGARSVLSGVDEAGSAATPEAQKKNQSDALAASLGVFSAFPRGDSRTSLRSDEATPEAMGLSFTFNASADPSPSSALRPFGAPAGERTGPPAGDPRNKPPIPSSPAPSQDAPFRGGIAAQMATRNSSRANSQHGSDAGSGRGSIAVGAREDKQTPASLPAASPVVSESARSVAFSPLSASGSPFGEKKTAPLQQQPVAGRVGVGIGGTSTKQLSAELGLDSDDDDVLKESLEPPSESGSMSLSRTPGKSQNPLARQSAGRGLRMGLFQDSAGAGAAPPGGASAAQRPTSPSAKASSGAPPAPKASSGAAQPKPWSTAASFGGGDPGLDDDDDDEEEFMAVRPKAKPAVGSLSSLGLGSLRLGSSGAGRGLAGGRGGGGGLGAAIDWNQANDPRW